MEHVLPMVSGQMSAQFLSESLKVRDNLRYVSLDSSIILKIILSKYRLLDSAACDWVQ
jgi:hypothetical protein